MKIRISVLFLLVMSVITSSSCVQRVIRKAPKAVHIYKHHMIDIDANSEHRNRIKEMDEIDYSMEQHYASILDSLRDYMADPNIKEKKVLLFFHGGMNAPRVSYKRTFRLTDSILKDGIFPIFINWHSGPLSSYGQHIWKISQGVKYHWTRAVGCWAIFGSDVLLGFGKSAATNFNTTSSYFLNLGKYGACGNNRRITRKNTMALYRGLHSKMRDDDSLNIKVQWGKDQRKCVKSTLIGIHSTLFSPLRATNFIWDGMGTAAWVNMKRRTHSLYHAPSEFDVREFASKPDLINRHLETNRRGVLAAFIDSLNNYINSIDSPRERPAIIAVGHSMGAIVLNDLLLEYPDFEIAHIIHMAGASSINEVRQSVFPYLERHKETSYYNLTLHPGADNREHMAAGLELGIARGSLLNHIDHMFEQSSTFIDRTSGKWDNMIQATHLIPGSVRGRVTLKCFDLKNYKAGYNVLKKGEMHPQKHGQFAKMKFWRESFWKISSQASCEDEVIK